MIYKRLPPHDMPYKLRSYGKHSKMVKLENKYKRMCSEIANLMAHNQNPAFIKRCKVVLKYYGVKLMQISYVNIPVVPQVQINARTIESFSEFECYRRFRFRKDDLPQVFRLLNFPNEVTFDNGSKLSGVEVFLFSLNRFTSHCCLEDLVGVFGKEYTLWVRAFHWFCSFMYQRWGYLLKNMLHFWVQYFIAFSEKIRRKLVLLGFPSNLGSCRAAIMIDCTIIASLRPGGGPIGAGGPLAERWSNWIQMAFYNGYKHHHGTKWQTLESPTGMCVDMYGPRSFRRSDLTLLANSGINNKLLEAQADLPHEDQKCAYGDGIYPTLSHILSRQGNDGMSAIRIANEWDYGITANLFPFIKWRAQQKLLKHHDISLYYFVATQLRNLSCCLYGNLTATYFETDDDVLENFCEISIEDYLSDAHRR